MRKFLIISHGGLATGMQHTLTLFLGENHPFKAISAYMDDRDLDSQISEFMHQINTDDELIILSDIVGGSVNQKMVPYISKPNTHIIAGFNLATLLQLSTLPDDRLILASEIEELINQTRESVVYVNEFFGNIANNDGDE